MLDKPKRAPAKAKTLSPKARARLTQHKQFMRMLGKVNSPTAVFEVRLGTGDMALTVRQRLMKAAEEAKKEIVVRKSEKGWLVGLATPERRSRRGRRKTKA